VVGHSLHVDLVVLAQLRSHPLRDLLVFRLQMVRPCLAFLRVVACLGDQAGVLVVVAEPVRVLEVVAVWVVEMMVLQVRLKQVLGVQKASASLSESFRVLSNLWVD
jgi:hypothetical protein